MQFCNCALRTFKITLLTERNDFHWFHMLYLLAYQGKLLDRRNSAYQMKKRNWTAVCGDPFCFNSNQDLNVNFLLNVSFESIKWIAEVITKHNILFYVISRMALNYKNSWLINNSLNFYSKTFQWTWQCSITLFVTTLNDPIATSL